MKRVCVREAGNQLKSKHLSKSQLQRSSRQDNLMDA